MLNERLAEHYDLPPVDGPTICLAVDALLANPASLDVTPVVDLQQLTPKENDVLQALLKTKTAREAAALLGISYDTVNFHGKNIRRKLGVSNTRELIAKVAGIKGS